MSRYVDDLAGDLAKSSRFTGARFEFWTAAKPTCGEHIHVPCDTAGMSYGRKLVYLAILELKLALIVLWRVCRGDTVVLLELSQWLASPFWSRRTLTIVHDLIPAQERNLKGLYYRAILPRILGRKCVCVSVSSATKAVLDGFGVKSAVVHPWVSPGLLSRTSPARNTGRYLFIGTSAAHKNLGLVLDALIHPLCRERTLVCVVPERDVEVLTAKALASGVQKRVLFRCNLSDDHLAELYRSSDVLISPSLNEGFGMPLVEAMALGCPVVCSDIPIYREVARHAALFFNPADTKALLYALQQVGAQDVRESLVAAGRHRAKNFMLSGVVEEIEGRVEKIVDLRSSVRPPARTRS